MKKNHDIIELEGSIKIRARSGLAILFQVDGKEAWLPLSQIECDNEHIGAATIQIPEWLALDKELI